MSTVYAEEIEKRFLLTKPQTSAIISKLVTLPMPLTAPFENKLGTVTAKLNTWQAALNQRIRRFLS